jgi:hypothetical protein
MPTEVWFRNPDNYIRELVECEEYQIAWDRGFLFKKKIDPLKHASLYYGNAYPYRLLLVGDQGTVELQSGDSMNSPTAVYPTWCYGEETVLLEEMLANPWGENLEFCNDLSIPVDQRPVLGQEHRVVITDLPNASSGPGRKFLRYLKDLQGDYPDATIHVHGLYGYKIAFGMGWKSVDVEPRTTAQKGRIFLPSGQEVKYEQAQTHPKWVTTLGFKPVELAVPRNRCMYNIKSAVWAGANYDALFNFRMRSDAPVDHSTPTNDYKPPETKSQFTKQVTAQLGDKFQCNTCSLQLDCKHFRDGAVCSVPNAEPTELARFFKTRDAGMIIDGLGTLLAANTRRLESGLREEEAFGDLNPEVSKIMSQVFTQGVQLAKMLDPALRGGPSVQVNVGGNQAQVAGANPQQLVAAAFRALEAQGFSRDEITPDMVQNLLISMSTPQKSLPEAVQGTVISEREG